MIESNQIVSQIQLTRLLKQLSLNAIFYQNNSRHIYGIYNKVFDPLSRL